MQKIFENLGDEKEFQKPFMLRVILTIKIVKKYLKTNRNY